MLNFSKLTASNIYKEKKGKKMKNIAKLTKLVTSNLYKEKKGKMKKVQLQPLNAHKPSGVDHKNMVINWGEFSTHYSKMAIEFCLDEVKVMNISFIADKVHDNWINAVRKLWYYIERGYTVEGGYSLQKRKSHEEMCVKYSELPYEEQLKDCYVIKDILTNNPTRFMHGVKWEDFIYYEDYNKDFEKYDIGW